MLRTRLLTALILIPIVLGLTYLGGFPFFVLVLVLTTLAEIEFSLLISRRVFRGVHLFGVALVWILLLDGWLPEWSVARPGTAAILALSWVWLVIRHGRSRMRDWTGAMAGALYLGLYGSFFVRLRGLEAHGLWMTLLAAVTIVVADSAALFVGTAWGQRKMVPTVSPGKTWEGYIGGVVAGAATGILLAWLGVQAVGPEGTVSPASGFVLGTLIGSVAPLGDLAVSVVKREAGVKDSGRLLPGHGGMLDRIDSVLWAGALAYYYVIWLVR